MTLPPLATERLASLPWAERMQAYADYGRAKLWFAEAEKDRRRNGWQWQLDLARAERAWAHYERALKKAQEGQAA